MPENLLAVIRGKDVEIKRLQDWVNDLHSGMYINCVYCGHRYGPADDVPSTMSQVLYDHIAVCPKHPLFEARAEIERLRAAMFDVLNLCGDSMYGGKSWANTELAEKFQKQMTSLLRRGREHSKRVRAANAAHAAAKEREAQADG